MVGFRVFDVGLLVLWLVWFFRLRDDDAGPNDEGDDDDGGGPPVHPPGPSGGGGLGLVMPGTLRAGRRLRDHTRPQKPRPAPWRPSRCGARSPRASGAQRGDAPCAVPLDR